MLNREKDLSLIPKQVTQTHVSKTTWKVLLIFSSSFLVIISLFSILMDLRFNPGWTISISLLFVLWFCIYLLSTYKYFDSIYLFTTAYVLSLAVFHLGWIIAHAVGWFEIPFLVAGDMAVWFELAGWYCLLAFGCFGTGMALALENPKRLANKSPVDQQIIDKNLASAYWIGIALLLASITALVLLVGSVGNILRFSRAEIFGGVGDTRGFGFFLLVAPSAMVLLVAGANTRLQKLFAYTITAITLIIMLFLGYRSSAMFPALIGAIIWVKLGRRIPLSVAVTSILIVLVAIPAISTLRSLGAYQNISTEDFTRSFQSTTVQDGIIQLGGVSTVVANVLKWVPSEDPYRYGQSYLLALSNAIPNVGLNIGESGRQQIRDKGLIDKEQVRRMNPGDWYIYRTNKYLFNTGAGAGFSTIAEAYLNFGLPGVIIYFIALGFALSKLDQVDLRTHSNLLIFSGAMLWPLIKTVRNVFGVFLKPVVIILTSILIWRMITLWKLKSR